MRLTKRKKIILGCVSVLLAFQLASYFALSSARLTSIALHLTPEQTHFARGTAFPWVLLTIDDCQNLTDSQKDKLLSLFRHRYRNVYLSYNDLPATALHRGPAGEVMGFDRGFSYSFSVVSAGLFWVRVRHEDYEGNVAASSGEHVYVWILGAWVRVWDGPLVVS